MKGKTKYIAARERATEGKRGKEEEKGMIGKTMKMK